METRILKIIGLAWFSWLLTACYNDLGNYEYREINIITIDTTVFDQTYVVYPLIDTLRIHPNITLSMDNWTEGRYIYCWALLERKAYAEPDTIATTLDLAWPVNRQEGSYDLFFQMKDLETGLTVMDVATVNIRNSYARGLLLLCEDETGFASVDMLSWTRDTCMLRNIIADSGLPPLKNPWNIWCQQVWQGQIFLSTGDGTYRLNKTTLKGGEHTRLEYCFYEEELITDGHITDMTYPNARCNMALIDGKLFFIANPILATIWGLPVNHYQDEDGQLFNIGDKIGINLAKDVARYVFYNTDEKCFVALSNVNEGWCTKMEKDTEVFSWYPGLEYVTTFPSRYKTNWIFTILKGNDEYWVYAYTINEGDPKFVKQAKLSIIDAQEFASAKNIGFSSLQNQFYYTVGSKLYGYDLSNLHGNLIEDFAPFEITAVHYDTKLEYVNENHFYVALYNSKTQEGKLVKYSSVENTNRVEVSVEKEWGELGKIVSMAMKLN